MTDSKTSHWKSLVADLTGTAPADKNSGDTNTDSEDPGMDSVTASPQISAQSNTPRDPVDGATNESANETDESEHPEVSPETQPKKKKRGSWAFWRSGNKQKKENQDNLSDSESAVSEDPLTMLNQAETTDDMASAIDQLFANSGSDTRGDEVVFDSDETATSIDFEAETKSTSRDAEDSREHQRSRSRDGRGSRSRRDDDRGGRNENRSRGRSRRSGNNRDEGSSPNDRERGRSRDDRQQGRSRDDRQQGRSRDDRERGRSRDDRRDSDSDLPDSDRRRERRRSDKPAGPPIDHGDVPTWDTAVSFVVDKNMLTRDGKSGGEKKSNSRPRNKSRN